MTDYNDQAPLVLHIKEHKEGGQELYDRFVRLDKHLVEEIHWKVGEGAAAKDQVLLTDHGPRHVAKVIRRIGELTRIDGSFVVEPKDAYFLAVAAHLHDVGNYLGRDEHEKRAREVLFDLEESLIGRDNFEKRFILDIARAHGGEVEGSKDTIGRLSANGNRRKLAAILRFADELAEDKERTSTADASILANDECLRKKSEVFHVYAGCLDRVEIDHDTRSVRFSFEMLCSHLSNTYYKEGALVYLLDKVFERTLKAHREQVYCSKFMIPDVVSDTVDVEINVCSERYERVLGLFHYTLAQRGYPSHIDISYAVPEAIGKVTGAVVAERIEAVLANVPESPELDLNRVFAETTDA